MSGNGPGGSGDFAPDEPVAERLARVFVALAGEVAVLRERQDTLERLLREQGLLAGDAFERFQPDAETLTERQTWRRQYLERVFSDWLEEIERLESDSNQAD